MPQSKKISRTILSAAFFIVLEIAAFSLLTASGERQGIWAFRMSNKVMNRLWSGSEKLRFFFSLKQQNEMLANENFILNEQLRQYREADIEKEAEEATEEFERKGDFIFSPASVVKISRNKQHNYFIINKGLEDGVLAQTGVVTGKGVVGIIDIVDKHYSYGISFMNSGLSVSARIGKDGAVGALSWDGYSRNGALMKDIPLQNKFESGDTVWTSGFSAIFPADIPIGTIESSRVINGSVNEIKVSLFEDFSSLRYVTLAENTGRDEILNLETMEEDLKNEK